jgi:hypothetical protein
MCWILQQDIIRWKDTDGRIICSFYVVPGNNKPAYYTQSESNGAYFASYVLAKGQGDWTDHR